MTERRRYRDILREIAMDNYGYVTTKDAEDAGVPSVELPKLSKRGGLDHVAYGLYRVTDLPPDSLAPYAEALLRAGDGAFLHGETVLALLQLADVNPRRIHVAVPHRARPKLPATIDLVQVNPPARLTDYEGLRAQPVSDALMECRAKIETPRLLAAVDVARKNGFMSEAEARRTKAALR